MLKKKWLLGALLIAQNSLKLSSELVSTQEEENKKEEAKFLLKTTFKVSDGVTYKSDDGFFHSGLKADIKGYLQGNHTFAINETTSLKLAGAINLRNGKEVKELSTFLNETANSSDKKGLSCELIKKISEHKYKMKFFISQKALQLGIGWNNYLLSLPLSSIGSSKINSIVERKDLTIDEGFFYGNNQLFGGRKTFQLAYKSERLELKLKSGWGAYATDFKISKAAEGTKWIQSLGGVVVKYKQPLGWLKSVALHCQAPKKIFFSGEELPSHNKKNYLESLQLDNSPNVKIVTEIRIHKPESKEGLFSFIEGIKIELVSNLFETYHIKVTDEEKKKNLKEEQKRYLKGPKDLLKNIALVFFIKLKNLGFKGVTGKIGIKLSRKLGLKKDTATEENDSMVWGISFPFELSFKLPLSLGSQEKIKEEIGKID